MGSLIDAWADGSVAVDVDSREGHLLRAARAGVGDAHPRRAGENAFSRPRYDHSIAALVRAGEQLSAIRALALENGWEWADAFPANTSPPPGTSGLNDWRRRAFPATERGSGWYPDEPSVEGLAEALECARRVRDYRMNFHNAWQRLRDR